MNPEIAQEFKEQIAYRLDESIRMLAISFEQLEENDIWKRHNEVSNSIGNLMVHLCGNIRQYGIASLGNVIDTRDRNAEFDATNGLGIETLLSLIKETVEEAKQVLSDCSVSELMRKREVQGFTFSGIGVAIHVTEHLSYHTGQIAFLTKQIKNIDLGFYDGMDLTIKNE